MNFWIACQGHSGSTWLAHVLGVGDHIVRHEEADPHTMDDPHHYEHFPIERWNRAGRCYGEVHGHLRRYLSPKVVGLERLVPRRAVLLRDKDAIARSAMRFEQLWMLPVVHERVARAERQLLEYAESDEQCRVIHLEDLSGNMDAVYELREWIGIEGVISEEDMKPRNVGAKL